MTDTDPQVAGPITLAILPWRDPTVHGLVATCRHGTITEYVSTSGVIPIGEAIRQTVAGNLRRSNSNRGVACDCVLAPSE